LSELQKIASETETTHEPGSRILAMLDVILDMRFPDDITISPDGKRVTFVVWERVPDEPKRRWRIWVAETSVGEARPLTNGKRGDTCPCWSPDGKQLAFLSQADEAGEKDKEKEKPQLYLIPAEG
jgi:dipeptidyl aminopeptidase/acylaminoacyl peptidase